MRKVHLQKKLEFDVPHSVIQSLLNIYDFYRKTINNGNLLKWSNKDVICVNELQTNDGISHYHQREIENFKLRNKWIFVNEDIILLDTFLRQHFSSFFQVRIDCMFSNCVLGWHDKHPYPRVFIPLHDNVSIFKSRYQNVEIANQFKVGECWFWDVRELHSVDNRQSDFDRIMACFSLDPSLESKADIFV